MSAIAYTIRTSYIWRGFRVWQRNRDAIIRGWKVELGGLVIEPFIVLAAIGFGLGAYVGNIGDATYAEYLAPGLIASYAMFHATFDSTYGAYLRMESHHVYEAMLFTPVGPSDIVLGEAMWGATRAAVSGAVVLAAAAIFGLVSSPLALLAIPCAYLIGLTVASIALILTATASTIGAMNNFFTVFIIPMFYVSGVFFPLDHMPNTVKALSWILPLTPAAALTRGLVSGDLSWLMVLWALELVAMSAVALFVASFFMHRRLIK